MSTVDFIPDFIKTRSPKVLVLIAAGAGSTSVLSMAPVLAWPVLFLTFAVLIWTFDAVGISVDGRSAIAARTVRGALIGWAFGFGYFLASLYWVGYAFLAEPSLLTRISMPFGVAGLAAGMALFYAAAGALTAALWLPGYARILGFVIAFFSAEIARSTLFTGFPWNTFGQALAATASQMQTASLIGINGLTLLSLFVFSTAATAVSHRAARQKRLILPSIAALVLLTAVFAFGHARLSEAPVSSRGTRVRIVQPNIPQREKWKPENRESIFERLLSLSAYGTNGTDIGQFGFVVWPESSFPFHFMWNGTVMDSEARSRLARIIPDGSFIVAGGERSEGTVDQTGKLLFRYVFNSLFVIGAEARIQAIYDKSHLVPFGEYMPFSSVFAALGITALSHRLGGFDSGLKPPIVLQAGSLPPFTPLICYEIIFSGQITDPKMRPEFIVNITNDAWFGNSSGPYQHLQLAQIRAAEEGLPIVRSANTGISAVIDPYGRIIDKLELGKTGVIDGVLPAPAPRTFFSNLRLPSVIILFLFPIQFYLFIVARRFWR